MPGPTSFMVIDVRSLQGNLTFWYIRPPKKTAIISEFQCIPTKLVAKNGKHICFYLLILLGGYHKISRLVIFHIFSP